MTSVMANRSSKKKNWPLSEPRKVFLLFLAGIFLFLGSAAAASDFFYLHERWEKSNLSGKTKKDAIEEGFTSAFSAQAPESSKTIVLPQLRKSLAEVAQTGPVEIEQGQSLYLTASGGILKFVSTDDGIVVLETENSNTLRIIGTRIGRTFIHIWDSSRRHTFELKVNQPTFVFTREQIQKMQQFEKSRPFKISYKNNRSAFYNGEKFHDINRTTLDVGQLLKV